MCTKCVTMKNLSMQCAKKMPIIANASSLLEMENDKILSIQ